SSPPMRIRPAVGSISRLIIFSRVDFPQPEGPTRITVSPSRMSMVTLSTAGSALPGYRLVSPSSSMVAPTDRGSSVSEASEPGAESAMELGTDPPGNGQPPDQDVRGVEQQSEDDDPEGAREHLVQRVLAAQRGDPAEDQVAQARPRGVRGDGGDAHQHLRG